jgi:hypothetical protein
MPRRGSFIFSTAIHLVVVALIFVHIPLFDRPLPEETPIVVELVNLAPETRATQRTETPPVPKKPEKVAEAEPPKPEPPKPEPPKPEPPKPVPPPPPPPPPPPTLPPPPPTPKAPEPKPPDPTPTPAPPKPDAKPKPPKPDDSAFDALLKNLAKRPLTPDPQPPDKSKPAPPAQHQASSQPIAPLGSQLSTSEIDLVRQQIEQCWNVPAGARDAANLRPEIRVYMNRDGTVRSAELVNREQMTDPFFQAAADSARRAVLNPRCQPLKLPPEKFDQWQTFTITFDPKDIT